MRILDVLFHDKTARDGIKEALLDVPLVHFAGKRLALSLWSKTVDDAVWLVSRSKQVRSLSRQGISPHKVYTAQMVLYLLSLPGMGQPLVPRIEHATKLLDATIIKIWEW